MHATRENDVTLRSDQKANNRLVAFRYPNISVTIHQPMTITTLHISNLLLLLEIQRSDPPPEPFNHSGERSSYQSQGPHFPETEKEKISAVVVAELSFPSVIFPPDLDQHPDPDLCETLYARCRKALGKQRR